MGEVVDPDDPWDQLGPLWPRPGRSRVPTRQRGQHDALTSENAKHGGLRGVHQVEPGTSRVPFRALGLRVGCTFQREARLHGEVERAVGEQSRSLGECRRHLLRLAGDLGAVLGGAEVRDRQDLVRIAGEFDELADHA